MKVYEEEIPADRLETPEKANAELCRFLMRLFEELGYEDMQIVYRENTMTDTRIIRATWDRKDVDIYDS